MVESIGEPKNIFSMDAYTKWYNLSIVKKSLAYQMKYREAAFLGHRLNVRNIKVREVQHLQSNMDRFRLQNETVNWYYSLAILKSMPIFSFEMEERKLQSRMFDSNFHTFMSGYDFALDFDSKHVSADVAYNDMVKVHNWMVENYICHLVRCSGSGFHIIVYSNYLWQKPLHFKPNLCYHMCGTLAKTMKEDFNLESLDASVYDHRRIWKAPYSMDIKTGNICRPLSIEEIRNFNWNIVHPVYCFRNRDEVFFNRRIFKGTNTALHKYIFKVFSNRCENVMQIWRLIEEYGKDTYKHLGRLNEDGK